MCVIQGFKVRDLEERQLEWPVGGKDGRQQVAGDIQVTRGRVRGQVKMDVHEGPKGYQR